MVGAERAKFLSTVQNQQDSDDNFFSRLREAARYADAEDEMIRKKFISGLRSADSIIKLPGKVVLKHISLTDMQTVLQFSDDAQHFSGTSKVNIK